MSRFDRKAPRRKLGVADLYADPAGRPWRWEEPSQQMGNEDRADRAPGFHQFR